MNMTKFKVGDKVRILDGSKINDYFGGWVDNMNKHIGKVCTIDDAYEHLWETGYHMKEIGYMWDERGLELAEDKPKHKFKVGDVVIAKKDNGYFTTTNGWRGVVTEVGDCWFNAEGPGNVGKTDEFHGLEYACFDLATDEKIIITHDGKTTTAKLFDGKKVMKIANARCCPSDEFDFNVGASIALARLTGQTENTIEEGLDFDEFLDAITCIKKFLRQLND